MSGRFRLIPLSLTALLLLGLAACAPAADPGDNNNGDNGNDNNGNGEIELPEEVDQAVRQHLAEYLGIDPEAPEMISVEREEWPSTALGCPDPDRAYADVIIPGYLATYAYEDEEYAYHTDEEGAQLVLCQDGEPVEETNGKDSPVSSEVDEAARAYLAERLDVDPEAIRLVRAKHVTWSDASLGCPQPDESYAQVLTPGYKLVYQHDDLHYDYHTNEDGSQVIGCGEGREPEDKPKNGEVDFETERYRAPIDELDLIIRESAPPQYALHVVSGVPSGCDSFEEYEVSHDGTTITVDIWNLGPAEGEDVMCTLIYGMEEHTIELGTDFEPGTEYTVHVNDEELTFTAQ